MVKKTKKTYFENLSNNGKFGTSKNFWNTVRPFITNKGTISNDNITIKAEENQNIKIENKKEHISITKGEDINNENILVEMFNNHYTNIAEKTSGTTPDSIGNSSHAENDSAIIDKIIEHYEIYPSICKIKNNQNKSKTFEFPEAEVEDINKIIKSLNPKKATGPDGIPIKIIRSAHNVIDSHMTNIFNKDLNIDKYSEDAKTAAVRPLFKKDDRDKIKNYLPVSILNGFLKIYERLLLNSLSDYVEKTLSEFIAAYRKNYSSNNVLLRLIENWKKHSKNIVGTVLMDLSKAFDCIPHDLLISPVKVRFDPE